LYSAWILFAIFVSPFNNQVSKIVYEAAAGEVTEFLSLALRVRERENILFKVSSLNLSDLMVAL